MGSFFRKYVGGNPINTKSLTHMFYIGILCHENKNYYFYLPKSRT